MESRTDNNQEPERGYFPFFWTFRSAIDELEDKDQLVLFRAITDYGFFKIDPDFDNTTLRIVWKLIKPLLDKSWTKVKSGQMGGGQKGNKNARKTSGNEQKRAKTSGNEQSGFSGDIKKKEESKNYKEESKTDNKQKAIVDVVDGTPRQKVLDSINDYKWIEKFASQYNVSTIDATDLANRVVTDWELAGLADSEWTPTHLLNAMRKKLEADNKSLAQSSAPNMKDAKEEWEQGLKAGAVQTISRIYSGVPGAGITQKDLPY